MLLKIRSINELLRVSGNRLMGGDEKKFVFAEKMYISNKLPELNELRQSALKIIIFRHFAFFFVVVVSSSIYSLFRINFLFVIIYSFHILRLHDTVSGTHVRTVRTGSYAPELSLKTEIKL